MPLSHREQARLMIERDAVQAIAQWMYQHQQGDPTARLSHIRDNATRAVFIGDAMELLSPERRHERAIRINTAKAHDHARADDEQQAIMVQARKDAQLYGDPLIQAFLTTNPRFCVLCKRELLYAGRATVQITEGIAVEAHSLCCAQREDRFEFISAGVYKLKAVR